MQLLDQYSTTLESLYLQHNFLSDETANRMLECGPETTLVEFDNTGHTPTLRDEEQVGVIEEWLAAN